MMYSEFLEKAQMTEKAVSYNYYTAKIEPIYMNCLYITQHQFCGEFEKLYNEMVLPVLEKSIEKIHKKTLDRYKCFDNSYYDEFSEQMQEIREKTMDVMLKYLEIIVNI